MTNTHTQIYPQVVYAPQYTCRSYGGWGFYWNKFYTHGAPNGATGRVSTNKLRQKRRVEGKGVEPYFLRNPAKTMKTYATAKHSGLGIRTFVRHSDFVIRHCRTRSILQQKHEVQP